MADKRQLEPGEKIFTVFLLIFSIIILVFAYQISGFKSVSSPGTFPMAAAAAMVASIGVLVMKNLGADTPDVKGFMDEVRIAAKKVFPPVFVLYSLTILAYMVALQPLHFLPSSFLFLLGSIIFLKGSTPLKSLFISIGLLAGIYLIFHYLFLVVLP